MKYYETSAETNYNINKAFNGLVKNILDINEPINNKKKGFGIDSNGTEKKERKCCK